MEQGFFKSLLDVSFTSFVTPKLIKILFVISLVLLGLVYIVFVISAFANDVAGGLFVMLIAGPIAVFIYALFYRVFFELIIVIFRIFENSRVQVALLRAANPQASALVPETGAFGPLAPVAAVAPPASSPAVDPGEPPTPPAPPAPPAPPVG